MIWILRLYFEEFCTLGWNFHHKGWENLIFVKFFMELVFFYDVLWMLAPYGKKTCIKGRFLDVHALFHIVVHSVYARCLIKCLLGIFSLVWTSMSTKLWSFSCFLIRNMFGSLIVYLAHLVPHVHFPCFGHALHIATSCTHICYPCHALIVYTLFLHPNMSCLPYDL